MAVAGSVSKEPSKTGFVAGETRDPPSLLVEMDPRYYEIQRPWDEISPAAEAGAVSDVRAQTPGDVVAYVRHDPLEGSEKCAPLVALGADGRFKRSFGVK